jgi:hypothetical protein
MNKVSKYSLITVGGVLGIATSLTVLGAIVSPPATPVAKTTTTVSRTSTVTVTATAEPTAAPTPMSTPVSTPTPTAAPTPTPRAAACPSGFHNGTPGDTYSGCFPNPTPTPKPSDSCQVVVHYEDGSTFYAWAIGDRHAWFCDQLKSSTQVMDNVTRSSIEQGHGTDGAHTECSGTFGDSNMGVVIAYDGVRYSEANGGAVGACTTVTPN